MLKNAPSDRTGWIDGLRFFAILWVFCVHFFSDYPCTYFSGFTQRAGYLLYGVTGKMCVAMFCVIMGYFCARSGQNRQRSLAGYITHRYVYFFLWLLLIGALTSAIAFLDRNTPHTRYSYSPENYGVLAILREAVTLGDSFSPAYWCIRPFLVASIAIAVMNRSGASIAAQLLASVLLYFTGNVWIMNCVLGSIVYAVVQDSRAKKLLSKIYVQIPLLLIAFFAIKRSENDLTYALDGIAMALVFLVCYHNRPLQWIFGFRPFAVLGRYSMGVYMLHVMINASLGFTLFMHRTKYLVPQMETLLTGAICFAVCFPLAWLLEKAVGRLSAWLASVPYPLGKKPAAAGEAQNTPS